MKPFENKAPSTKTLFRSLDDSAGASQPSLNDTPRRSRYVGFMSLSQANSILRPRLRIQKMFAQPPPPSPNKTIPRLYISNILTAKAYLSATPPASFPKITHVLSIHNGSQDPEQDIDVVEGCTIVNKVINIPDTEQSNLLEHFPKICYFIHTALQNKQSEVLVHCRAGISRSASAITAYLVWARRESWLDALEFVASKRAIVCPNAGFLAQLELWEDVGCDLVDGDRFEKMEYVLLKREKKLKARKGREPDLLVLRKLARPGAGDVDVDDVGEEFCSEFDGLKCVQK